ncbi:MAG: trimeric intracellular cation channel family protein [Verrucomicrobiota bacterium]
MLPFIEFLAVVSAAGFGILLARAKQMDIVGCYTVALATALGGGTLRDVLLDRPVFWIGQPYYPILIFVLVILGMAAGKFVLDAELKKFLQIPDALGLGLFAIVGTGFAMESIPADESMLPVSKMFVASLFGVITGCFGGVIADIICNEVPNLFRTTPLYATCAFSGSWLYLLLSENVPNAVATTIAVVFIVALRLLALKNKWTLPVAGSPPKSKSKAKKKAPAKKKSGSRKRSRRK